MILLACKLKLSLIHQADLVNPPLNAGTTKRWLSTNADCEMKQMRLKLAMAIVQAWSVRSAGLAGHVNMLGSSFRVLPEKLAQADSCMHSDICQVMVQPLMDRVTSSR